MEGSAGSDVSFSFLVCSYFTKYLLRLGEDANVAVDSN